MEGGFAESTSAAMSKVKGQKSKVKVRVCFRRPGFWSGVEEGLDVVFVQVFAEGGVSGIVHQVVELVGVLF